MNHFTKDDILELLKLTKEGTPLYEYLMEHGISNKNLKKLLLSLPNHVEYKYVYEFPLKVIPKTINDPRIKGFCLWRLSISK